MKTIIISLLTFIAVTGFSQPNADEILEKVDKNMSSENRVFESSMTIHGKRSSRTITLKSHTVGDKKSFTEYLSPAREHGRPQTDRLVHSRSDRRRNH